MAIYFTDTMPYGKVSLDTYPVTDLKHLPDQGTAHTYHLNIEWEVTNIDWGTARQWCIDNNFITVLLRGSLSMQDFKEYGIGNESVFKHAPNRQSGPPVILEPGDRCLVMYRIDGIMRWQLIKNIKFFSDVAKPFIDKS